MGLNPPGHNTQDKKGFYLTVKKFINLVKAAKQSREEGAIVPTIVSKKCWDQPGLVPSEKAFRHDIIVDLSTTVPKQVWDL